MSWSQVVRTPDTWRVDRSEDELELDDFVSLDETRDEGFFADVVTLEEPIPSMTS